MNDKPDWLVDFEKRKEERLKEYDEKINKFVAEMTAKTLELREEKEDYEKRMQKLVDDLMEDWVIRKKK